MNICNVSVRTAGVPLKNDMQIERDYKITFAFFEVSLYPYARQCVSAND